jgi:hypothetical protein
MLETQRPKLVLNENSAFRTVSLVGPRPPPVMSQQWRIQRVGNTESRFRHGQQVRVQKCIEKMHYQLRKVDKSLIICCLSRYLNFHCGMESVLMGLFFSSSTYRVENDQQKTYHYLSQTSWHPCFGINN